MNSGNLTLNGSGVTAPPKHWIVMRGYFVDFFYSGFGKHHMSLNNDDWYES